LLVEYAAAGVAGADGAGHADALLATTFGVADHLPFDATVLAAGTIATCSQDACWRELGLNRRGLLARLGDLQRGEVGVLVDADEQRTVRLAIRELNNHAACALGEQVAAGEYQAALAAGRHVDQRAAADVGGVVGEVVMNAAVGILSGWSLRRCFPPP
jgi:hypothetical protein